MMISQYIEILVQEFRSYQDTDRAMQSAKYMRNYFSYFGVGADKRKTIQKKWFEKIAKSDLNFDRWELIREMWIIEQREIQYVAIDFMNSWKKSTILKGDIKHIEWLITNKSWWDSVDSIASNYLGEYFKKFPEEKKETIGKWRNSENKWLNRSCFLFQLKYKNDVDFDLLKSLVVQFQHNNDFFIQKAIGWSLRQYSKFNPESVRTFILEINLQGLAKREASKYVK